MKKVLIGITVSVVILSVMIVSAGTSSGSETQSTRDTDQESWAADQNPANNHSGGLRPRRDRDAEHTRPPQVEFECIPAAVGLCRKDLVLTCVEPLVIGDEFIDTFTVRHNIRFAPAAASVIAAVLITGRNLVIVVDEPFDPHGRCQAGCRRLNELATVSPVQ